MFCLERGEKKIQTCSKMTLVTNRDTQVTAALAPLEESHFTQGGPHTQVLPRMTPPHPSPHLWLGSSDSCIKDKPAEGNSILLLLLL